VASGGNDGEVKVWDVERGRVGTRLRGHRGFVWNVAATGDGFDTFVSGGTDSAVCLWDARAGPRPVACAKLTLPHDRPSSPGVAALSGPVAGLSLHPTLPLVATSTFDGFVRALDLRVLAPAATLGCGGGAAPELRPRLTRCHASHDLVLAGSFDGTVHAWTFG